MEGKELLPYLVAAKNKYLLYLIEKYQIENYDSLLHFIEDQEATTLYTLEQSIIELETK